MYLYTTCTDRIANVLQMDDIFLRVAKHLVGDVGGIRVDSRQPSQHCCCCFLGCCAVVCCAITVFVTAVLGVSV